MHSRNVVKTKKSSYSNVMLKKKTIFIGSIFKINVDESIDNISDKQKLHKLSDQTTYKLA